MSEQEQAESVVASFSAQETRRTKDCHKLGSQNPGASEPGWVPRVKRMDVSCRLVCNFLLILVL